MDFNSFPDIFIYSLTYLIPFVTLLGSVLLTMSFRSLAISTGVAAVFFTIMTVSVNVLFFERMSVSSWVSDLGFFFIYVSLSLLASWLTLSYLEIEEPSQEYKNIFG